MVSKKRQLKATPTYSAKRVLPSGVVIEIAIYRLPQPDAGRPHGYKYRLFCGDAEGRCLVRYDNEQGKGDHVHYGDREQPYVFASAEQLLADFARDIAPYCEDVS